MAEPPASITHQVCALVAALAMFIAIWFIGGLLMSLVTPTPGFEWASNAFRDILAPWIGGDVALTAALGWFKKSTPKFVFLAFASVSLVAIGIYLGFVGPVHTAAGISIGSLIWAALTVVAGIFGAYRAAKRDGL